MIERTPSADWRSQISSPTSEGEPPKTLVSIDEAWAFVQAANGL